jgi:hypothetical protein
MANPPTGLDHDLSIPHGADLAGLPLVDLALPPKPGDDLAPPPDLARTTPPVVTFSGQTATEQHPAGTSSPAYTDVCPAGEAIAGFNLLIKFDTNGLQQWVFRTDLMCVHPDVAADGKGGWTVTWGRGDNVPGHGVDGAVNVQLMCPMNWFLTGYHGRAGAGIDALAYTCAAILFDANGQAYMGPNLDIQSGVGGMGGSAYPYVYCPAGQIANTVFSRALANTPADAWGLGCATVASH